MPRVGEYELGRTIGRGAFSKVKLVTHIPTDARYVAKIVPKTNKDVEIEIRVEIGILRRVRHPNIVQLIEILESPRNYYIILEAVTGGDLCDMVIQNKNGIPEKEASRFAVQILEGLRACHGAGVAHRDLKPENLLLTEDKEIKISDFGLSRLHKESCGAAAPTEMALTLTGTLAYVAPEVLKGAYDAFKADIWSYGCILYVMLTCRFPFGSATDTELETRIKKGEIIPMPDSVNPDARDLVKRLIVLEPSARLTLDQIAAHPWIQKAAKSNASASVRAALAVDTKTVDTEFCGVEDPSSPVAASPNFRRPARPRLG